MARVRLLSLQILVGFAMLAVWHVLTVYPILGDPKKIQFFFSDLILGKFRNHGFYFADISKFFHISPKHTKFRLIIPRDLA